MGKLLLDLETHTMDIQTALTNFLTFINSSLIPLIVALAFIFFLFNVFRYFILGGANEEAQSKAKLLAVWGILAFVIIISLWGIVNFFVTGFGFGGNQIVCPDYFFTHCN